MISNSKLPGFTANSCLTTGKKTDYGFGSSARFSDAVKIDSQVIPSATSPWYCGYYSKADGTIGKACYRFID